jgi:UDP-glucuronate decarboxylase
MKTVLVAGGAGFLGSHLVEVLLKEGKRVVIVDDFSTSSPVTTTDLRANPAVKFIEHNIIVPFELDETVTEIYNFACPASPVHYQKDPIRTMLVNTVGVINLLNLARQQGARFLQASTSEIYGNPLVHPQIEEYHGNVNPIGPRACYDEGKRCAETLCFDYARTYGVVVKVVRIFNTYGPRMSPDDGRVVPNFIKQALENQPITIYGEGEQTRSFCFVDDLIRGIVACMKTGLDVTGPINLGNPLEMTIRQLASEIIRLTGSSSALVSKPLPQDDPERRRPDITRARTLLGWEPQVGLEQGLIPTIAYFRKYLTQS